MAVKIYDSGAAIIIENASGNNDKQIINSSSFDWSIDANMIYHARDKIENQSYNLGTYSNVKNFNDVFFTSNEELQSFLNSIINNCVLNPSVNSKSQPVILKDIIGNDILATIFGELTIGNRIPSISAQFQYGLNIGNVNPAEDTATITQINGGNVSIYESELLLQTGVDAAGFASIQSNDYIRYLPGYEAWCAFTVKFDTPDENGDDQNGGLYDSQNGFYLKYNSTGFYFVRRKLGVDYPQIIDIDSIFPQGGFNPEYGNIYMIKYGYLGFANITIVAVNPKSGFNQVAKIEYAGKNTTVHTAQTFLPLRAEILNSGSTTNKIMKIGSVASGIINGNNFYPSTRFFTKSFNGTIGAGTTLIAIFRNKNIFYGIQNRVKSNLLNVSASFEGTKPLQIIFLRNPTITVPGTWFNYDPNSIFEINTTATIDVGTGREMKNFDIAKSGQVDKDLDKLNIFLRPNEYAAVLLKSAGSGDYTMSLRWDEQF